MDWTDDMGDGYGYITESAATAAGAGLVTSAGITPLGPGGSYNGFSIGTNADIQNTSAVLQWSAWGN